MRKKDSGCLGNNSREKGGFMPVAVWQGIWIPFLGTTLGAAGVFFLRRELPLWVQRALTGFAAGVMVAASIWSLLLPAMEQAAELGPWSFWPAVAGFWLGILFLLVLDRVIPHLHRGSREAEGIKSGFGKTTMLTLAVALHNIPEGIAVSVPIFFATGSRKKAFKLSFLSGLSEPLGAIIGFFLIYTFIGINSVILGVLFALVAGIMVFISLDELLPTAKEYGAHHLSIYGLVAGMALMAFSLLLF